MSAIKQQQYKHYQCSLRTKNRVKTGSSLTLHSEQLVTSWTTSKTKEKKKQGQSAVMCTSNRHGGEEDWGDYWTASTPSPQSKPSTATPWVQLARGSSVITSHFPIMIIIVINLTKTRKIKSKSSLLFKPQEPISVQRSLRFSPSQPMAVHPGRLEKPRSCTCRTKVLMQCPAKVAHHIRAQVEEGRGCGGVYGLECLCEIEGVCVCVCVCVF